MSVFRGITSGSIPSRSQKVCLKIFTRSFVSKADHTLTVWDQLNIAKTFGMDQVWILNVGDLKLVEIPLDYFLSIAYDSDQWGHNSVTPWLRAWAARDFGEEFSEEVADVMGVYSVSSRPLANVKSMLK